jgi:hypothetical protein
VAYKFNPFTGKLDYYEAAGTGFATTELDNLGVTNIGGVALTGTGNVRPAITNTYDYGSSSTLIRSVYSRHIELGSNSLDSHIDLSDGTSANAGRLEGVTSGGVPSNASVGRLISLSTEIAEPALGLFTANSAADDAVATTNVYIETGNKTAGAGNSGNIIQQPGTSAGGLRGYIYHNGRIINANQGANGTTTIPSSVRNVYSTTGASNIVLTLPPVAESSGSTMSFMKADSGAGSVEIDGDGSETIGDGTATSFFLHHQAESVTLFCTGATWLIIGRHVPSIRVAYTPTLTGFGTAASIEYQWRRVGDTVEIRGKVAAGTSTATEARVTLPTGVTSAATGKIPSIQAAGFGIYDIAFAGICSVLIEPSVAYMTFGLQGGATGGLAKALGSALISSGNTLSINATIPVTGWEG